MKWLPNIITGLRIACIPLFVSFILRENYLWAFYTMIVIAVSDLLDGFLARQFRWHSQLGAYLDPVADMLIIIITFALYGFLGILPLWLAIMVIGRDVLLCINYLILYCFSDIKSFKPCWSGKLNTFLCFVLLVVVTRHQFEPLADMFIQALIYLTTAVVILSSMMYTHIGWKLHTSANYRKSST